MNDLWSLYLCIETQKNWKTINKAPYTENEERAIYHLINNEYAKEVGEFLDITKESDKELLYM